VHYGICQFRHIEPFSGHRGIAMTRQVPGKDVELVA
ncbi:MAG: hypothetical protein JWM61_3051, partial [Micrococcaceae bacterium]|nr:hypothetical protein [Micrococcaceae bacterium]